MSRFLVVLLLLGGGGVAFGKRDAASKPRAPLFPVASNAVVLNLTEEVLNDLLLSVYYARGGPDVRVVKKNGLGQIDYKITMTPPRITVGEDGLTLFLSISKLAVPEATFKWGLIRANCKDLTADIPSGFPLEIEARLSASVVDGKLEILDPADSDVEIRNLDRVSVNRPETCETRWMTEGFAARRAVVFAQDYISGATELVRAMIENVEGDLAKGKFLRKRFVVSRPLSAAKKSRFVLSLDTLQIAPSFYLSFNGLSQEGRAFPQTESPGPPSPDPSGAYIAISQSFLKEVVQSMFSSPEGTRFRPRGNMKKVFNSDSINALVDLRDVSRAGNLEPSLRFIAPPDLSFGTDGEGRASIYLHSPTLEISLWDVVRIPAEENKGKGGRGRKPTVESQTERKIGSVIVEAEVGLRPQLNEQGELFFDFAVDLRENGIRVGRNQWKVESNDLIVNEQLLRHFLRQRFRGFVTATRLYALPFLPVRSGKLRFVPAFFELTEAGYLQVPLEFTPEPRLPQIADALE